MIAFAELSAEEWEELGQPSPAQYEAQTAELERVKVQVAAELRAEVRRQEREQQREFARRAVVLYGPCGTGGNNPPPARPVTPEQSLARWQGEFAEAFNAAPRDRYGQRQGLSSRDVDRYATSRFVAHLSGAIARAAYPGGR